MSFEKWESYLTNTLKSLGKEKITTENKRKAGQKKKPGERKKAR